MHPTLHLGRWTLSSYTLLYGLALLAAGSVSFARLYRGGMEASAAGWTVLFTIWAGFAGAMGLFALIGTLLNWIGSGVWAWQRSNGYGPGLACGVGMALLCLRRYRVPLGYGVDRIIVGIPLGQAIGRVGCLMAGCCAGQISDSWWALTLPDRNGAWLPRYPARIMASVANLAIFCTLLLVDRWSQRQKRAGRRGVFDGGILWAYLGLYALKRFCTDFIRADAQHAWGPLSVMQYAMAGVFVVAAAALVVGQKRQTNAPLAPRPPRD